jgi:hypothetical protein
MLGALENETGGVELQQPVAKLPGEAAPEPPTPVAPACDPRLDLVRALADGAARAFAAGDSRAARVALAALSGLVGRRWLPEESRVQGKATALGLAPLPKSIAAPLVGRLALLR